MATEEQKKEFEKLVKEKQQAERELLEIKHKIKDIESK